MSKYKKTRRGEKSSQDVLEQNILAIPVFLLECNNCQKYIGQIDSLIRSKEQFSEILDSTFVFCNKECAFEYYSKKMKTFIQLKE